MKKVALFGGAFDPPHFGHALVAHAVLDTGSAEEVWLVPSGDERYDKAAAVPAQHRAEMLALFAGEIFEHEDRVKINLLQLEDPALADCAAIALYDAVKQRFPDVEFKFVVGLDILDQIPNWKEADRVMREMHFIVVPRKNEQIPAAMPEYSEILCLNKTSSISSSKIRGMLQAGAGIDEYTAAAVCSYIRDNRLYTRKM